MLIFPDKLVSKKNFLSTSGHFNHIYCFLFSFWLILQKPRKVRSLRESQKTLPVCQVHLVPQSNTHSLDKGLGSSPTTLVNYFKSAGLDFIDCKLKKLNASMFHF